MKTSNLMKFCTRIHDTKLQNEKNQSLIMQGYTCNIGRVVNNVQNKTDRMKIGRRIPVTKLQN